MIVDVRIYNIVPRKMNEYLALFERYADELEELLGTDLDSGATELT